MDGFGVKVDEVVRLRLRILRRELKLASCKKDVAICIPAILPAVMLDAELDWEVKPLAIARASRAASKRGINNASGSPNWRVSKSCGNPTISTPPLCVETRVFDLERAMLIATLETACLAGRRDVDFVEIP